MQKSELIKRIREIEAELKKEKKSYNLELIQELANSRAGIPGNLLKQYDRLKKKLANPLVILKDSVCQGCHMTSSLGMAIIAKAHRGIYICEHCGRLLYVDLDQTDTED